MTPASSQFASNGLGFGYLVRGTIPINPYLVVHGLTGLYNSYSTSYGASAVVDLSTLTQVSQINAPINYDQENYYFTYNGNVVRFFNDPIAGASFTNFFSKRWILRQTGTKKITLLVLKSVPKKIMTVIPKSIITLIPLIHH